MSKTLQLLSFCIIFANFGIDENALFAKTLNQNQPNSHSDFSEIVEKQERQIKTALFLILIPIIVAFSFIVFIFYRKKREAYFRQSQAELQLKIAQVELKALRAQINPHFIFNCLNSVHHYMHKNDIKLAGEYLVKFSQLIRFVLESSSSRMVPLREDLDVLKIYMELEQLRMDGSFRFEIHIGSEVDPEAISIPPMMLQPFVENSIWHGLNNSGLGGYVRIDIHKIDAMIEFVIEDNGKKTTQPLETVMTSVIKKTSLGLSLIKDRLDVVNRLYNVKAYFKIEDRNEGGELIDGRRITLSLPYEE